MMNRLFAFCWISLIAVAVSSAACGEEPQDSPGGEAISYFRDIRPIFQEHCHGCHQPAKQSGDYEMTGFERLLKGGESEEAAIVPGTPAESFLMAQLEVIGGEAAMPKDKPPLAAAEIALIRAWIEQGANNDTPVSAQAEYDMEHPPVYPALPVINSLDFSPDGKQLAVAGYHEVLIHQADGGGLVARLVGLAERIESARFSPDGKRLAVAGGQPGRMGELQIWNVEDKSLELSITAGFDTLYGANWSPDGKLVSFGCCDNTVRAIRVETGEQVFFNGAHSDWVLDTAFSVNGEHLVSVSRDMSMKLYVVETERFVDNITSITPGALKGGLHSVDRHPAKEELLIGGADGVPKIYRMHRDQDRKIGDDFNLIRACGGLSGRVFSVAYNHDGTKVVAGSSYNGAGQIKIFNEADGKEVARIDVPEGGVFTVAFHPGGQTIAAAGFDGIVRLYSAADGSLVKEFAPVEVVDSASGE